MASTPYAIRLSGVGKVYPGAELSLRGTKLEAQGPALWLRNLGRLTRLTAAPERPVRALDEVSFAVRPGEILGVLGPNGSGKTTLVKIVAGLIRPSEGNGEVAGVDLDRPQEVRRHVSYVSTTGWMGLEWSLTAEENVRFFGALCGLGPKRARERAREALTDVGLWADRDKMVAQLSNGMRQRAILARALLLRTPVVLLDEPTVGLDPIHREDMLTLVRRLVRERSQTVVLVDHQADAIEGVVDRALVLGRGRVRLIGPPGELAAGLGSVRVVDLLTRDAGEPRDPPPAGVLSVQRTPRPGPLSVSHWRLIVSADANVLEAILAWAMSAGGEIVEVSERAPGLADIVAGRLEPAGALVG